MADLQWFTCDDFIDDVGQTFGVAGATVSLQLVEASESDAPGGPGPHGQVRNQFSLVFVGPADTVLPQSTYVLSHPRFGDIELFLVPLGPDQERMRYEAAFA